MRTRFDFEQQVIGCWSVIDEIGNLNKYVLEGKVEGGEMSKDDISNYLLGLETIYRHKFEQLWNDFEEIHMGVVRENKELCAECNVLRNQILQGTK
jgi:hypothetical protein